MASCITPTFGSSTSPQLRLTITNTSQSDTKYVCKWVLDLVFHGYAASSSAAKSYSAVINGKTVASGSTSIGGINGTKTLASGYVDIYKTTYAQTISFSCSMGFNISWSGVYGGTKSASSSFNVPAQPTYTITYNANGGTGVPGAQSYYNGQKVTLSSTRPTRTGYTFLGWDRNKNATSPEYWAGGVFQSLTLGNFTIYAIWKANTYPIAYNANGGTGAPATQTKTYGVNLTLSSVKPTKTNYNFKGWGTSAASTTVAYAPGAVYKENASATLYAIWELAYTPPRINITKFGRAGNDGQLSDDGQWLWYTFNWETDKPVEDIVIEYKEQGATEYKILMHHAKGNSDTSGKVEYFFSLMSFDPEKAFDIKFTVLDVLGNTSVVQSLPPMIFEIDLLKGGGGIAFGKPASRKGFEVAMDATFEKTIKDRFGTEIGNGLVKYEIEGIDPDTTTEHAIVTHINTPMGTNQYMYIFTYFYGNKTDIAHRMQMAFPYNGNGSQYHRYFANGSWTSWRRHINEDEFSGKTLWEGGAYMNSSQTITLSEPISKQKHGIVIEFTEFKNNTPADSIISSFFVHKQSVVYFGWHGRTFSGITPWGKHFSKYLYIYDNKIIGADVNQTTGDMGGVNVDNKAFVLRHVYGV
ncbi:InlB B-repeat-containing protein [Coprococcus phoceensis]|uniref:InlB B-repeat-containing protein n=1 Tax=Coprococcus phoceensis TaxID=1870993 RepID=UPI003568F216